jgi:hypothetical protein
MSKRKNRPKVTVTHDRNEYVSTPVEHIVPRLGAASSSTTHSVLIPISPERRREPFNPSSIEGTDPDFGPGPDDETLGHVHYIQAPHARKRFQAAVCSPPYIEVSALVYTYLLF